MFKDKTQRDNAGFGILSPDEFKAEYQRLIAADLADAQARLDDLPENQRRGLSLDTLRHFHCGYLKSWVLTKSRAKFACGTYTKDDGTPKRLPPPSERIIIPTPSMNHFNAVATPAERRKTDKKFWKQHQGTEELFCDPAALSADTLVVVEGEMDCMSIHQATGGKIPVIAILGCGNQDKTIGKNLAGILKGKRFVIMFDADAAGRKSAETLRATLIRERVPAVTRYLYDYLPLEYKKNPQAEKIDANEILRYHGAERLMLTMKRALETAAADLDRVADKISKDIAAAGTETANPKLEIISARQGNNAGTPRDARYLNLNHSDNDEARNIIRDAIQYIPLADESNVTRGDWFIIGCVMNRYGFDFADFDAWSKSDPARYEGTEDCRIQWQSMTNADGTPKYGYKIGTLINIAKKFGYQPPPMEKLTADEIIADIRRRCDWKFDSKKRPVAIKPTQANLNLIFNEDPNLSKLFGYDRFQGAIVFLKKAPWHDEDCAGDLWHDTDAAELRVYLRQNYAELKDKQGIEDTVIRFASENSFNAVKIFLEGLPKWDGTPRAENLFVKFLHAEDSDFTREVTLKWLLGAIARVYHPGCDFQICLVLQGAQRIGKSKLVKMLGGKEQVNPNGQNWHVALKDSVDDAHAVDALQKGWIIEIEEFSAARKAEINALKTFLSADDDTRRFSYDKYATTRKRHVAFVVTCNDGQFLRDPTGNARFIIVKCSQKKFDRVPGMTPEYIRQVWAEVYQRYNELFKDGFDESKLQLELETQIHAEEIAERYLQDDGLTGEVKAFVGKKIPVQVIWKLMSKDDRRKFFVDGKFTIEEGDLDRRFKTQSGRITSDKQAAFDKAKEPCDSVRRVNISQGGGMPCYLTFYGSELREHICAAEIFNEAIANGDKRKQMYRIEEILSHLDGWHVGERNDLRRADPEYPDQRKPYFRNPDNRLAYPAPNSDDLPRDTAPVADDDLPL